MRCKSVLAWLQYARALARRPLHRRQVREPRNNAVARCKQPGTRGQADRIVGLPDQLHVVNLNVVGAAYGGACRVHLARQQRRIVRAARRQPHRWQADSTQLVDRQIADPAHRQVRQPDVHALHTVAVQRPARHGLVLEHRCHAWHLERGRIVSNWLPGGPQRDHHEGRTGASGNPRHRANQQRGPRRLGQHDVLVLSDHRTHARVPSAAHLLKLAVRQTLVVRTEVVRQHHAPHKDLLAKRLLAPAQPRQVLQRVLALRARAPRHDVQAGDHALQAIVLGRGRRAVLPAQPHSAVWVANRRRALWARRARYACGQCVHGSVRAGAQPAEHGAVRGRVARRRPRHAVDLHAVKRRGPVHKVPVVRAGPVAVCLARRRLTRLVRVGPADRRVRQRVADKNELVLRAIVCRHRAPHIVNDGAEEGQQRGRHGHPAVDEYPRPGPAGHHAGPAGHHRLLRHQRRVARAAHRAVQQLAHHIQDVALGKVEKLVQLHNLQLVHGRVVQARLHAPRGKHILPRQAHVRNVRSGPARGSLGRQLQHCRGLAGSQRADERQPPAGRHQCVALVRKRHPCARRCRSGGCPRRRWWPPGRPPAGCDVGQHAGRDLKKRVAARAVAANVATHLVKVGQRQRERPVCANSVHKGH